ncbi:MAG: hypothetical protein AM325_006910 [Candidatus Thorarchaeota archaeon SMTZ1-45]|nr:MAG: hypothetical protein AM325_08650 [Candidatus Thorarchaeota archaeon SMTZ1-45]
MKLNKKHAFVIIAIGFLFSIPAVTAANTSNAVLAQDVGEEFFFNLIENGAEVVFTAIDEQGAPAVIYGQLGVPDSQLGLGESMYDGCVVMALIATQGELLEYILDLVGAELFNFSDGGELWAQQFGEGGSPIDSVFDMLGTDFSLLINVYFDLTDAEAQTNMAAVRAHLHSGFAFDFEELLNLRIDEEFIESIIGEPVDLPFTGINLFIYKVTNPFEDAVNSVLDVMDQSGFIGSIDSSVFTTARASGAGLLAVPDMGDLMDLIESFGGGEPIPPAAFLLSQMPELDGPMAIVAAGYIGDQILSTNSDELNIFEDLLGKPPTGVVNGLDTGQSLVAAFLPPNMNLTSYSPEDEALNRTFYDANASVVFWNATAYSDIPDYTINFEPGAFPPLVTITRTFDPIETTPGGSVEVTVTVHNEGTEPVYNLSLVDDSIAGTYPISVDVTGETSADEAILLPDGTMTITYSVTFEYEGVYAFAPAEFEYDYGENTFSKRTHMDRVTVSPEILGLLQQMFWEGYPFTAIMGGAVALGAVVNIVLMARGRGGGGTYQV